MTRPNGDGRFEMREKTLFRRLSISASLYIIFCCAGLASACDTGCTGTCSIVPQASGTYLDPAYIASSPAVTTPTLVSLLTAGAPIALIDCRSADALAEPRIPGSLVFVAGWNHENIAGRFPGKDILVILYDGGAVSVRGEARRQLAEAGFSNILQYPDGIRGWIDAGQATIPTASDCLLGVPDIRDIPMASDSSQPVSIR